MGDSTELSMSDLGNAIWTYLANMNQLGPHSAAVDAYNKELLKRPLGKEAIQNNPYDRAKNFSGGYDWGYRTGDERGARNMGLFYQKGDALFSRNPEEEMQDFEQNLAGIRAGIKARNEKREFSMEDVLRQAEEYGLLTPLDVSKWR